MTRSSPVLSTSDLPGVELQAARLDGELFRIDGCFCPVDEFEGPAHRGAALAAVLPGRVIAEQRTAAWIWGVTESPPDPHQLCASSTARVRPPASLRIAVREVVIDASSVVSVGGMSVTTVIRTVVDLARFSDQFDDEDCATVRGLMRAGGLDLATCIRDINSRRNLPNKRRATERIRLATAGYPEFTRYTS